MTAQKIIVNEAIGGLVLFLILCGAYYLYLPGIDGGFIFDDVPNLSPLEQYQNYSFWDRFWLFLLEGTSGPTGRPLSLASFYLNDTNWPSQPKSFIYTNILIHLLNGILVFWLVHKLSSCLKFSQNKRIIFSLFTASLWLLHPMHLTSVLYIIQRMTELSATFTLTGLIFYLYGRKQLTRKKLSGMLMLFIGVGMSLILSILSKENGILLVAYILVVEFFLLQPLGNKPPKHFNYWLIPAVVLPFVAILIYLGLHTDNNNFINRDFSLTDRLLTEPRILFDYLHQIILPKMGELTLYHDDYIVSKNLFSVWTTLPSILGIITLFGLAIYLRKKAPLITFAIAWFFAGHLIESTVLALELYFEHRNYLPMLGIFIAIIYYATYYFKKNKAIISIVIMSLIVLNSFILSQNAKLWGKPVELIISWYQKHPDSNRARQDYLHITNILKIDPLNKQQDQAVKSKNTMLYASSATTELARSCYLGNADPKILDETLSILKNNIIHTTVSLSLNSFIKTWSEGKCPRININHIESFLLALSSVDDIKNSKLLAHDVHYALSNVYRNKKNTHKMILNLEKAYTYYPHTGILMLRAGDLASAGHYKEALEVLDDTSLLKKGFREKLVMHIKQKELDNLKLLINKEMKKKIE